ncbi:triosephosphate isomerase [Ameyamaea chiangmaiensis NBRC 103196]|nr:triosephosphate isomerase [Ameyamaea chiangmaiensis NBRC 103196]
MNGLVADARTLARAVADGVSSDTGPRVVVCPSFVHLSTVAAELSGSAVALGAQDCHHEGRGAFTGDISAPMLADIGVRYVILGHSERRAGHQELDEMVRQKAVAAASAGLVPVVCVGETQDQRAAGQARDVIGYQIEGSLPQDFAGIVAYEPVWAIGTGQSASIDDIADMMAFIRAELARQFGEGGKTMQILYGGSVTPRDASAILRVAEVGGALVGGASLKPESFLDIVRASAGD